MGYLAERVSYLRGLVEGIDLDKNSKESRIFDEIIELLDDMATSIEGLEETQEEMSDELAETQLDVDDIINIIDGEGFEDEYDEADDYEDEDDFDEEDEEDEEEEYCEKLECPNCGTVLPIDIDLFDQDEIVLKCPECGEDVTITLVDEEEDGEEECTGDCANCPSNFN